MLIFTQDGLRLLDQAEVLALYRGREWEGNYQLVTLCLASGEELRGYVLKPALDSLEASLNDFDLPLIDDAPGTKPLLQR